MVFPFSRFFTFFQQKRCPALQALAHEQVAAVWAKIFPNEYVRLEIPIASNNDYILA
jgi:hypothetical protein